MRLQRIARRDRIRISRRMCNVHATYQFPFLRPPVFEYRRSVRSIVAAARNSRCGDREKNSVRENKIFPRLAAAENGMFSASTTLASRETANLKCYARPPDVMQNPHKMRESDILYVYIIFSEKYKYSWIFQLSTSLVHLQLLRAKKINIYIFLFI